MRVVYAITNVVNGRRYVGSAENFERRKKIHLRQLREQRHHSAYLQNAWNKYGQENFFFSILEEVAQQGELLDREQWWLDNSASEYNICRVAGSSLGVKRRPETIEKLRQVHLGEKHPEWRRQLKSQSQGGAKHWSFGKKMSSETKKKKSDSMKRFYQSNASPRLGTKHTEEVNYANRIKNFIPIEQYNRQGDLIRLWDSPILAQEELGVFATNIVACCKGRVKSAGGFVWKYKINKINT